jgi:hypothetical protein
MMNHSRRDVRARCIHILPLLLVVHLCICIGVVDWHLEGDG